MSSERETRCWSCGMPSHRQDLSGRYGTYSPIACINELRHLIRMQLGYEPEVISGITPCGCPWFGDVEPDVCPTCDKLVVAMGVEHVR